MTEPLVSVEMITYNHAPYIAQAIEGVLQQKTNFPFELVIGEDCSTDGTREIVFEYQKKYPDIIRVITSDQNVGARKNGYRIRKACRGKYIALHDGDDYWHNPLKLQKQVDYLESHPECGLVYSSYDIYDVRSKKRINDYIKYRNWEMPVNPSVSDVVARPEDGGIGCGITSCTVMMRRTLYQQIVAADPYIHQSEQFLMGDIQIWAEIAHISHLHYIPESLATHILTLESITRSEDVKKLLRYSISHAELSLYLCNKYNLPPSIRNKSEESWCIYSLRLALHTRSAELADEVRKKKKTFTWKERLLYYGAKNLTFYYLYRLAAFFRNLFRKKRIDYGE